MLARNESLPLWSAITSLMSLKLPAGAGAAAVLNSFTLAMYLSGSFSNLPLQSSQQKAISWFLKVNVFDASMSLSDSGHLALMGFAAGAAGAGAAISTTLAGGSMPRLM